MAKTKQTRRMIAMALAAAVTMSAVPVVAFAEEEGGNPGSEGGSATGTVTVTITQDKENNTTTTKKETNISTNDTSEDGSKETDYKGHKTETSVTEGASSEGDGTPEEPTPTYDKKIDTSFDDKLKEDEISKSQKTDETTTTVEKTEDGTTKTVENVKTENSVDAEGNIFESNVTNTEVVKNDADGNWVETNGVEEGEEKETTAKDWSELAGEEADVTVPMIKDGETLPEGTTTEVDGNITTTTTVTKDETTGATTTTVTKVMTESTGDVNSSNGQTTVRAEREVSVTTEGEMVKVATGDGTFGVDESGRPVYIGDKDGDGLVDTDVSALLQIVGQSKADTDGDGVYDNELWNKMEKYNGIIGLTQMKNADKDFEAWEDADNDGYTYAVYKFGHGTLEYGVAAYGQGWINQVQMKNYLDPYYNGDPTEGNATDLGDYRNTEQPLHVVYCLDMNTDTVSGVEMDEKGNPVKGWYQIQNMEDAEYMFVDADGNELSDEESQNIMSHVRYIVKNGYWGTSNEGTVVENEDGTTTTTYETGSLNALKETLKAAGQEATGMTEADIDALTDGEALVATQMAIWKYGHSSDITKDGGLQAGILDLLRGEVKDEAGNRVPESDKVYADRLVNDYNLGLTQGEDETDADYLARVKDSDEYAAYIESLGQADDLARINTLAAFLASGVDLKEETEVITEKNFVESMEVVVGDKLDEFFVDGEDVNNDTIEDNDGYNVSLKFALAVDIDPKSGDMVLKVVNEKGETVAQRTVADTDGNVDEEKGSWTVDENGNYTVSGLQLQENSNSKFSLTLEGIQFLEEGVYIYSTEDTSVSQTMVGMASGERVVDLEASVDMNFNVKEGKVTTTRKWKETWHDEPSDDGNPPGGGDNTPPSPDTDIPDEDVPLAGVDPEEELADIGEEEVPLVDVPEEEVPLVAGEEEVIAATGDSNHMTAGFGGMLAALAGMFMLRRKKEQ